jgi:amino acid adenylation domain-containing protein
MTTNGIDLAAAVLATAARTPDAIAVIEGERCWSYAELAGRAREVAGELADAAVEPGEAVAVPAIGGGATIAAMLGVLLSNAAYVAIDPADPAARVGALLDEARVRLVLPPGGSPVGRRDGGLQPHRWGTADEPPAYIVFTSGSTGAPKGVVVSRAGLGWHARTVSSAYGLTDRDVVLQAAGLVFDVAAEEIWPTLVVGATVAVPGTRVGAMSYSRLTEYLRAVSVSVVNLPSSMFAGWAGTLDGPAVPDSLRLVVAGSEPLPGSAVTHWRHVAPGVALVNAYGLSESTITSLIHPIDTWTSGPVPIGHPLPGMVAEVVGPDLRPVASGQVGELVLAGPGLALGYTDPVHDRDRFVVTDLGGGMRRCLRTGDLARRDGEQVNLEGRADDQLKIAGRRIEPGEICQALLTQPGVRDVRVVALDGQLVACAIGRGTEDAVLDALRADLPAYLVPPRLLWFDAFPVTSGGKVDRRALADAARERLRTSSPPRATPDAVRALWQEVLRTPVEDGRADFFALGGNSLQVALLLARLRRDFGVTLTLTDMFGAPLLNDFQRLVAERATP